jgi:hypothetical protein
MEMMELDYHTSIIKKQKILINSMRQLQHIMSFITCSKWADERDAKIMFRAVDEDDCK